MRILVIHNLKWKSLNSKFGAIKAITDLADIEPIEFVLEKRDYPVLEIENGRITHEYFDRHFKDKAVINGYSGVFLLLSKKHGAGLDSSLRGSYQNDVDPLMEGWIVSDENDRVCIGKKCVNKVVKSFLHELCHGLCDWYGVTDNTHDYDYKNERNDIKGAYEVLVGKSKNGLLELLKYKLGLLKPYQSAPLPPASWSTITQPYLNPNKTLYPATGVHVGTDFRGKIGDPVYAPSDGQLMDCGCTDMLGNWLEYKRSDSKYLVALHLRELPRKGWYKRGEVIGILGSTGFIKGVHYHLEGWNVPMNRALLTSREAVLRYTFDITR